MSIPIQLARDYLAAGLCVLPAQPAEKRPALAAWRTYQSRLPTEKEVEAWFSNGHEALCIVAGAVSGSLECIDFDAGGECFEPWTESIPDDLFGRLVVERTPSGGVHVSYRCEAAEPNRKLAEGMRDKKRATLIETRGEGGLFLCAPSPGYRLVQGGYDAVPTISEAERRVLLDAAIALSELPDASPPDSPAHPSPAPSAAFDERPGDAFNRDEAAFYALLERHGWRFLGRNGENLAFQRPGKTGNGLSATFNGVNFHVFSSNAEPFPVGFNGSPFTVYALLEHGGDATAAAKDLLGRGYGRAADPCAGVDLTGILSKMKEPEEPAEPGEDAAPDDPGPIPDGLLDAPGFIDDLVAYTMATAHKPNRVLAFAGALAFLSYLLGRRFKDAHDTRLNAYILAIAPSGSGKEHPRTVNKNLADLTGFGRGVLDDFGSAQGVEDFLVLQSPSALYQVDEIDTMFNKIRLKDAASESISKLLLSAFSASNSYIARRSLAAQRGRGAAPVPDSAPRVREPNLVLFGTGVPHLLYDALTKRSLENGLFARCLAFETKDLGVIGRPVATDTPSSVMDYLRAVQGLDLGGNLSSVNPSLRTVPFSAEAEERARRFAEEMEERKTRCDEAADFSTGAIWGRAAEKQSKLALAFALSRGLADPRIEEADVARAAALVEHLTRNILYRIATSVHESDYEEQAQRVMRLLRARGGRMAHGVLLKASHLDRDTFRRVIETLIEGCQVVRESVNTGRKAAVMYSVGRG